MRAHDARRIRSRLHRAALRARGGGGEEAVHGGARSGTRGRLTRAAPVTPSGRTPGIRRRRRAASSRAPVLKSVIPEPIPFGTRCALPPASAAGTADELISGTFVLDVFASPEPVSSFRRGLPSPQSPRPPELSLLYKAHGLWRVPTFIMAPSRNHHSCFLSAIERVSRTSTGSGRGCGSRAGRPAIRPDTARRCADPGARRAAAPPYVCGRSYPPRTPDTAAWPEPPQTSHVLRGCRSAPAGAAASVGRSRPSRPSGRTDLARPGARLSSGRPSTRGPDEQARHRRRDPQVRAAPLTEGEQTADACGEGGVESLDAFLTRPIAGTRSLNAPMPGMKTSDGRASAGCRILDDVSTTHHGRTLDV